MALEPANDPTDHENERKMQALRQQKENAKADRLALKKVFTEESSRITDAAKDNVARLGLAGIVANMIGAPLAYLFNAVSYRLNDMQAKRRADAITDELRALEELIARMRLVDPVDGANPLTPRFFPNGGPQYRRGMG